MLEIRALNAGYGLARVVFDLDLGISRGETVALIGRNGSGKSTTLKSIMGLLPLQSGRIELLGQSICGLPPHVIARRGIGYVPEDRRIFTSLTAAQNLEVGRQPIRAGLSPWTVARVCMLFPSIAPLLDRPGGQLSGGEQQMLAIARTLMGNPAALLLDEPSEGLAPLVLEQLIGALRSLKQEGIAILLCEQNLRFAHTLADRCYLLERGRLHPAANAQS